MFFFFCFDEIGVFFSGRLVGYVGDVCIRVNGKKLVDTGVPFVVFLGTQLGGSCAVLLLIYQVGISRNPVESRWTLELTTYELL